MKIMLNILTHGDERIGLLVAEEIKKLRLNKNCLFVQIANKKAFQARKRFIDQDLNRSFPGKKNGNHEQRLAYRLSPIIKSADIVLDIHSTQSELRDALIVTNLNIDTLRYIKIIQPKYVLTMQATKNNALISQAKVGLAFEYGKDKDPRARKKIVTDIKKLLCCLGLIKLHFPKRKRKTKYFCVVSEVEKPKGYQLLKTIKNYHLVRKGQIFATNGKDSLRAKESFYPILFGQRNYQTIFGFKAIKYDG